MRRLLATADGTKKRRMLAADSTVELPPFFSIVDIAAVEEKELKESNVALAQLRSTTTYMAHMSAAGCSSGCAC